MTHVTGRHERSLHPNSGPFSPGGVPHLANKFDGSLEAELHDLQSKLNLKPRPAFMTIRLAVTGRPATPPLFDVLHILGQAEVIKRLTYAQKTLSHR